jgi:hypothetical protein
LTCWATWSASSRVGSSTSARTGWRAGEVDAVFVLEQAVQQRQRERRGLAGAGLGRAHHVLAGHHDGNGLGLDGGHGLVAHFGHGACQRLGQRKV